MKKCKDCEEIKPLSEFYKQGISKDGIPWYRGRCKKCHRLKFCPATGKPNAGRFKKGHKPENPFKKGNVPWNKGKSLSEEHKNKISLAKKKKGA